MSFDTGRNGVKQTHHFAKIIKNIQYKEAINMYFNDFSLLWNQPFNTTSANSLIYISKQQNVDFCDYLF